MDPLLKTRVGVYIGKPGRFGKVQQLNSSFDVYLVKQSVSQSMVFVPNLARITWVLVKIQVPCYLLQKPHKMITWKKVEGRNLFSFRLSTI